MNETSVESAVLKLGRNITILPVIHGSGDFAVEVRRLMLSKHFDCLAVPLPPSFRNEVEAAVDLLPGISVVLQREPVQKFSSGSFEGDSDESGNHSEGHERASYVPIDPCQPVVAALRIAIQEHMHRAYIDPECDHYQPRAAVLPDPYALKRVLADQFAAAVLPVIPRPESEQQWTRIHWMAWQLHQLSKQHESVLLVCNIIDWPWLRDAFNSAVDCPPAPAAPANPAQIFSVDPRTLLFVLGELPFITSLYELARAKLDSDENLSIDGIKALLIHAREHYRNEFKSRARKITPHLLSTCLKYIRNLSLMDRRFTPDLYTLITASSQIAGDQYAIHVAEAARDYAFEPLDEFPLARFGVGRLQLPDGTDLEPVNRLPGHPVVWRSCQLKSRPEIRKQVEWQRTWNPFGQCSWPPEDVAIERFRTHIKDVALEMLGNDMARTEKFSSSMKDGLDIRETLRNWHTGDLFVKVFPPARGKLDCVVMLFDSPADPRDYPWRITWHAENHDESTLALFATSYLDKMIGPGISLAQYGGCMFLFPPRPVVDIWRDARFDFVDTLEERLIAAALHYSNERHIALMSHAPPGAGWRRLASKYKKKIVHVPMNKFGTSTIEKLRMFHVLNGHQVRSFASHFIRKP
ncbi:MAG: hypothetical protein R3C20_15200 [Planctomycetaceae bacterium]